MKFGFDWQIQAVSEKIFEYGGKEEWTDNGWMPEYG